MVPTAAVHRAPSECARCGSTGSIPAAPSPFFSILLEEVQDLAEILLVLVFGLADVPPPLGGVPDFHAVVEAHQHDFLFLIDLNDLAEPSWDQNPAGFIDIRRAGFGHYEMHE